MQSWTENSTTWVPCWLVSSQLRVIGSSQAPFRCSDWPCARPVSPGHFVEIHMGFKDVLMFGDENLARPTSRPATNIFKRLLNLMRDLQRCGVPWIWRANQICSNEQHHRCHSVIFDHCAFGTPGRLRTKLIAGHCDYQDILPLAEYSTNEHHACAFIRRPHIQLHGKDLSGRQFTAPCKVLPPSHRPKHRNTIIPREIGNRRLQLLSAPTSEHPTSSALWDDLGFCGHISRFGNLSWPALHPRQSRQLHQT